MEINGKTFGIAIRPETLEGYLFCRVGEDVQWRSDARYTPFSYHVFSKLLLEVFPGEFPTLDAAQGALVEMLQETLSFISEAIDRQKRYVELMYYNQN